MAITKCELYSSWWTLRPLTQCVHVIINEDDVSGNIISATLVVETGLFNKRINRVDLSYVSDIDTSKNFMERVLGFGDIYLHSHHERTGRVVTIQDIELPHLAVELLSDVAKRVQKDSNVHRVIGQYFPMD